MRIWLVRANEAICDHVSAFQELGFISWVEARNARMDVGDTVYVIISGDNAGAGRLRYKTEVTRIHEPRQDIQFWEQDYVERARQEITCRLVLRADYGNDGPTEAKLQENGLIPGALQHPNLLNCNDAREGRRQLSRFIIDFDNKFSF